MMGLKTDSCRKNKKLRCLKVREIQKLLIIMTTLITIFMFLYQLVPMSTIADGTYALKANAGLDITINEDEIITFDGSKSTDNGSTIINYTWDFGDGYYSYGMNTSHSYPKSGIYIVALTVRNIANDTDTDTLNVYVNNLAPNAEAGDDQTLEEGKTTLFNGNGSTDTTSDNSNLTYIWYFGDGTVLLGMTVKHVFRDDGVYTVTLVVIDDDGDFSIDTMEVIVKDVEDPVGDLLYIFGILGIIVNITGGVLFLIIILFILIAIATSIFTKKRRGEKV